MSSLLRKCVAFGPDGTIDPGIGQPQNLAYQNPLGTYHNVNVLLDSGTRWVKIWADLLTLWPQENGLNQTRRDGLDFQIALAKAYGFGVILSINFRLPQWITGAPDPVGVTGSPLRDNQDKYFSQQMPKDTSPGCKWELAFKALASRYSRTANPNNRPLNNMATVDIIEFCNEPNQNWYELNPDGFYRLTGDVAYTTATLFKRARNVINQLGGSPIVAGPATGDLAGPATGNDWELPALPGRRNYYDFTKDVLANLAGNGFYKVGSDLLCMWTQHNYSDVCFDQGRNTQAPSAGRYRLKDPQFVRSQMRASVTRTLLQQGGWKGFPTGSSVDPRLYLTEGGTTRAVIDKEWGKPLTPGADPTVSDADYRTTQALLTYKNLVRLSDDVADTGGAGIEMMTTYLLITSRTHDSGLLETDLTRRSVYSSVWKPYPGRF
jgi:hypothetical protein